MPQICATLMVNVHNSLLPFGHPFCTEVRTSATSATRRDTGHFIASYCFQGLIGLPNLLSVISCYKFHILKDRQENIRSQLFVIWPPFCQ